MRARARGRGGGEALAFRSRKPAARLAHLQRGQDRAGTREFEALRGTPRIELRRALARRSGYVCERVSRQIQREEQEACAHAQGASCAGSILTCFRFL